jgi:hypothetical protein
MADQSGSILGSPVSQVIDEGFDELTAGFTQGFGAAEVGGVAFD